MDFFSFTFTIPAFKKVYYDGKKRKFGSLSSNRQFHFLEQLMVKICISQFEFVDWVYEKHDDGRLHIHGYVALKKYDMDQIYLFRHNFYTHNNIIGMSIKSYLKVSDIQRTYKDISYWKLYCIKHQNEIVYKNKYSQSKIDCSYLDRDIECFFDFSKPNDRYLFGGKYFFTEINKLKKLSIDELYEDTKKE